MLRHRPFLYYPLAHTMQEKQKKDSEEASSKNRRHRERNACYEMKRECDALGFSSLTTFVDALHSFPELNLQSKLYSHDDPRPESEGRIGGG